MESWFEIKVRGVLGLGMNDEKQIVILGKTETWGEDGTRYEADESDREQVLDQEDEYQDDPSQESGALRLKESPRAAAEDLSPEEEEYSESQDSDRDESPESVSPRTRGNQPGRSSNDDYDPRYAPREPKRKDYEDREEAGARSVGKEEDKVMSLQGIIQGPQMIQRK